MENELFGRFCHARKNSIAVDGWTVKTKDDEIALKLGADFKYSYGLLQWLKGRWNVIWLSVSREGASTAIDLAEKCQEHVKPIVTIWPEWCFRSGQKALFYYA
jgi:hypothetical protein